MKDECVRNATKMAFSSARVCISLLCGGVAAGCASMGPNLPAEAYANQQATVVDVMVFLGQGPMEAKFQKMHEGMSKEEVFRILGKPDRVDSGTDVKDADQTLLYLGRFPSGWSWDRADYTVTLRDGHVAQFHKGPATRQPPPDPPPIPGSPVNWGTWKWGK
jgi:hypothetical protein